MDRSSGVGLKIGVPRAVLQLRQRAMHFCKWKPDILQPVEHKYKIQAAIKVS